MLRDILFYIKRTSKFFREIIGFIGILFLNYRDKKGCEAEVRIGCNGYPSGQKKDWLFTFMQEHTGRQIVLSWYRPTLIFASCFGSYWLLRGILFFFRVPSVFFSEENLATLKKYREYKSYLNGRPTLAMGFDYCTDENYRRFPLWLMYMFSADFAATASIDDIRHRLDRFEQQSHGPKTKFAAMVASHDGYASEKKVFGSMENMSRSALTEQIATIDFVHCPGVLLHNDDSLKAQYNDDKISYLKQFVFNICAENASVPGYVTEKLFDAVAAGAIPIYWGDRHAEPAVLNQQRIIFWDGSRVEDVLAKIEKLYLDVDTRRKFLRQPMFTDCAAQEIHGYFSQLRRDFDALLAL